MHIIFFQVLIKLIRPYTRIYIPFISKELNIDVSEVESLLVSCILDNTIHGRIDQVIVFIILIIYEHFLIIHSQIHFVHSFQVNQVLELDKKSVCAARYNALDKWAGQLQSLHTAIVNKMS